MKAKKPSITTILRVCFILFFTGAIINATAQSKLELSYLVRADQHARYTTRYFDRSYTNDMRIRGISHGVNLQYIRPILQNLYFSLGAGYYRLGVQGILSGGPWGTSDSRIIDYQHPSGIKPVFVTDRYAYNTLQLSAGLRYQTNEKEGRAFSFGTQVVFYQGFLQKYHIKWDEGINYRILDWRTLGYGFDAQVGMIQRLKNRNLYFHPKIVLPLYQRLNGDPAFGEPESMRLGNWMSGLGFSMSIGKDF